MNIIDSLFIIVNIYINRIEIQLFYLLGNNIINSYSINLSLKRPEKRNLCSKNML